MTKIYDLNDWEGGLFFEEFRKLEKTIIEVIGMNRLQSDLVLVLIDIFIELKCLLLLYIQSFCDHVTVFTLNQRFRVVPLRPINLFDSLFIFNLKLYLDGNIFLALKPNRPPVVSYVPELRKALIDFRSLLIVKVLYFVFDFLKCFLGFILIESFCL